MNPNHPEDDVTGPQTRSLSPPFSPQQPTARPGAASGRPVPVHSLPRGSRLHEFELTDNIGEGGFSIVYLAWDHSLERVVALKEYMPGSIASRDSDTRIGVRSADLQSTFDAGLRSFINEGKLLASFDHPSLVKVYRFWEAQGTAYMVMPFYEGLTLKDTVQAMASPPSQAWILEVLAPLAEALSYIHARSCYHRDIAPDNILMLAETGRPLLLDFGAARRVITDMSQALTVIVKAGYAPIEQYADVGDMHQGAWTDVHALAAVMYWMITGKKPPAAISRMLRDTYVPLAEQRPPGYAPEFLAAIDRGLALLPANRTQSIEKFAEDIGLRIQAPGPASLLRSSESPGDSTRAPAPRSSTFMRPEPDRTSAPVLSTSTATHFDPTTIQAAPLPDDDMTVAHPTGLRPALPPPEIAPAPIAAAPPVPLPVPVPEPEPEPERGAPATATMAAVVAPSPLPRQPPVRDDAAPALAPAVRRAAIDPEVDAPPPTGPTRVARSAGPRFAVGGGALLAIGLAAGWFALRTPTPVRHADAPATAASVPEAPAPARSAVASEAVSGVAAVPSAVVASPLEAPTLPVVVPVAAPPAAPSRADAAHASPPRTGRGRDTAADGHPPAPVNPNAAECARIMQRLSLGEAGADLLEKASALKCK